MTKKPFLILFFLIGGLVFQNCSDDPDCDFGPSPEFFDIKDVEIRHVSSEGGSLEVASVSFSEYGFLRLSFDVDYIAKLESKKTKYPFMNPVYGCTPEPPGLLGSKEESFESLQIITINDYDEDHKAGDSINDILELNNFGEPILLSNFLLEYEGNVPQEWFSFKLLQAPTIDKEFQVKVEMELSTGETYEELSSIINFE